MPLEAMSRQVSEEDEEKDRKRQYTQDEKALYKSVQQKTEASPNRQSQNGADDS
jgi:hypothetical protein